MARKRITEQFPFLIPIRKKQRAMLFYLKMHLDKNLYAKTQQEEQLAYPIFHTEMLLINEQSGFDIQYQENKKHNIKIAAKTLDHLIIKPGEVFSYWKTTQKADKHEKYKPGLRLDGEKVIASYGGGLCLLSDLLFWAFLNTPLTIIERHPHGVEGFPPMESEIPIGVDATITEGWLDLKVKNNTESTYQIRITIDEQKIYMDLLSNEKPEYQYHVFSKNEQYQKEKGEIYRTNEIHRQTIKDQLIIRRRKTI